MKRLALLLALALCLCACGPAPVETLPAETTLPTQTTAPPETNQPSETTASPFITDFTPYEAMISYDAEPNWLARAMDLAFEKPEDVSLYYLFYPGVNYPGTWNDVSAESRQTLISHGFSPDFDLQIMPVWLLEEALQTTFGIRTGRCDHSGGMVLYRSRGCLVLKPRRAGDSRYPRNHRRRR